jgi:uncharacterized protein (DUF1330 family)
MYYYFLAQIKINDETVYKQYLDKAGYVFSRFEGEYLAIDNEPQVLEGKWDYTRTILIRFKSKKDFEKWYYSEEYQQILKHRLRAAECDTVLIKGMD